MRQQFSRTFIPLRYFLILLVCFSPTLAAGQEELELAPLIAEALKANPEIRAAQSKAAAAQLRIPQARALADPMVMFGYQNEGYKNYTYGDSPDAQYMYSVSQMFPFPGKRALKAEMAAKEAGSLGEDVSSLRLKTVARVAELYYDLFLAHKKLELISERKHLFNRLEEAALARYSAGTGMQQDVLMAQTEKYMLLEGEQMQRQRLESLAAMLNSTLGRSAPASLLGRPREPVFATYQEGLEGLTDMALKNSPEVKAREQMLAAAEVRVKMAAREYYPDFTLAGSIFERKNMDDMWSLTATVNVPIFYKQKQRPALHEAEAALRGARSELEAVRLMITAGLRDNLAMVKAAEQLMAIYRQGLIPKARQNFESALSSYMTGGSDALTVISRLRVIIDSEDNYWQQLVEAKKAVARIEALAGVSLAQVEDETGAEAEAGLGE